MTRARIFVRVRSSLWFVPVLCVVAGAILSFGTILLDRHFGYGAIPQELVGGPDAAMQILSTIAASMVSLTALVLTITMVVVQLAMGQFSPRIVQRILQDRPSQLAIGLFVATFVHAILALREVTSDGSGGGRVPGIAVVTGFALVLVSIAVLVVYVHHIGQALRVSALIELVGKDTRALIDRLYPDRGTLPPSDDGSHVIAAPRSGVITAIGDEELVAEARRTGCVLELIPALGEFVPAGAPLFRVHGAAGSVDERQVQRALILKSERTLDEDVTYGVRLLVDIAERSLSDSPFQDPTTAVQALDRLHDILRQLVERPFPDGRYRDADGEVRLITPVMTWDAFVRLAFEEIRLAGAASPQVSRRLKAALVDLRAIAPPDRIAVIDEQLELLDAAVDKETLEEVESRRATSPDPAGMGVEADGQFVGSERPR